MKVKNSQKGMVLIATVMLLLLLGLFLGVGFGVTQSGKSMAVQGNRSTDALAIATAGANWYLQQLTSDSDWTDNVANPIPGQAVVTRNFVGGTFAITVTSATAANVSFRSTGTIAVGTSANPLRRYVSMTAVKS